MATYDFTTFGNFGNDPHRAEQLTMASAIDLDTIHVELVIGAPIGGHGFRSGYWTGTVGGEPVRFFSSVSHAMDLDAQHKALQRDAALHIAGIRSGYVREG
jgi:hypothetical protein